MTKVWGEVAHEPWTRKSNHEGYVQSDEAVTEAHGSGYRIHLYSVNVG